MRFFNKMRQQKLLSVALLLITLCFGIIIGTVVNTGVRAARSQAVAPGATPLVTPNAVKLGNEFTELAKKLAPSVVNITADFTPKADASARNGGPQPDEEGDQAEDGGGGDLFRRFFHGGAPGEQPQRPFKHEQSGSGFIVDKNGYIITNNHVVEKVDHIKVRLHGDATEYKARLVGFDRETDLAVLKIEAREELVPVSIGNSEGMQVGDWAVAIGSPFGLEASVTAGIVSATGREIAGTQQFQRFIQTDAAINPGNSGGPLLNIRGEVVGVNTMIATQTGGYQGIGFALPMNMAVRVYNDIIRSGRVVRGSIGIGWGPNNDKGDMLKAFGAKEGVVVGTVTKDGPADKAGIKEDDIIVALNGKPVKGGDDLVTRISQSPIGSKAAVTVDRGGKKMDLPVTILDRAEVFKKDSRFADLQPHNEEPAPKAEAVVQPKFGIKIRTLQDAERDSIGLEGKKGVVVTAVDANSFAEEIRLTERDVIVSINRQPVTSVEDVHKIQGTLKPGDAVAFRLLRRLEKEWASFLVSGKLPVE